MTPALRHIGLAVTLAAATAASLGLRALAAEPLQPAPSATPLREIGRVRSTFFCATLHQNVRLALHALVENDKIMGKGHDALEKMASDQVQRARASIPFDRSSVDRVVRELVHNVGEIEKQLDHSTRFPAIAQTDDERKALEIKAQLESVLNAQKDSINVLNGTVETDRLGQMQREGLSDLQSAIGPESAASPSAPGSTSDDDTGSYLAIAGLPALPQAGPDPRTLPASSLIGNTLYGKMAFVVAVEQARSAQAGRDAARTILTEWRACDPARAPPAATPSGQPSSKSSP